MVRAYKSSTQAAETGGSKKWSYPGLHKNVLLKKKKYLATILISSMYLLSETTIFHICSTLLTLLWWLNSLSAWLNRQMQRRMSTFFSSLRRHLQRQLDHEGSDVTNGSITGWVHSIMALWGGSSWDACFWLYLTLAPFCILSLLLEHQ